MGVDPSGSGSARLWIYQVLYRLSSGSIRVLDQCLLCTLHYILEAFFPSFVVVMVTVLCFKTKLWNHKKWPFNYLVATFREMFLVRLKGNGLFLQHNDLRRRQHVSDRHSDELSAFSVFPLGFCLFTRVFLRGPSTPGCAVPLCFMCCARSGCATLVALSCWSWSAASQWNKQPEPPTAALP